MSDGDLISFSATVRVEKRNRRCWISATAKPRGENEWLVTRVADYVPTIQSITNDPTLLFAQLYAEWLSEIS